ncbi:MAG TPA: hypothetical protein VGP93_17115, partial [Polyangiaceae bacterium]|jgi:hypothetical protein|nr:hypothetical protein [Polyangiaceae bacterium]
VAVTTSVRAAAEARQKRALSSRRLILIGALVTLVGIALSVNDEDGFGGWLTIAGLVTAIAALHRYGRLGADGKFDRLARADED